MKRSVFVTGAAYGTGRAIAERFAEDGYNVFISGRRKEEVEASAASLSEKYGVYARGFATTEFSQQEVKEIFLEIKNSGYSVDTIVLNAANLGIGQNSLTVDIEEFMQVYDINVKWNFMMAREAALLMIERKRAR